MNIVEEILIKNSLITAFVFVGVTVYLSYFLSEKLTKGRFHGSAIAIILGLIFAYIAGSYYEGDKGVADIAILSGVGVLGGSMLRDFAIVATAYGAKFSDLKTSGVVGVVSLFLGVILSFSLGSIVAILFGYDDAKSITTIGAGGGSIAHVDQGGLLEVGPESAGSDPGPVCYGNGNKRPTVTDANLVLGRINGEKPIGGKLEQLDSEAARESIREHIAEPLGMKVMDAAEAIIRVAN